MSPAKPAMSKRERVVAAMNLQETDRVPIYDLLFNDAAIEHFSGRPAPMGEEGLKVRMEASAKFLDMTRGVHNVPQETADVTTPDGFVHCRHDRWRAGGIRKRPFSDEAGAREWLGGVLKQMRVKLELKPVVESHRAHLRNVQSYLGDDTVVVYEYDTGLDWVRYLLGIELFCYVWAEAPELISEYMEISTSNAVDHIHAVTDPALSPCVMTAGDIAFKGRLMHSPEWLRAEFLPRLKRLNDAAHEHDVKVLFHSDGYLMDILPDLIDAGIDGLNPIETTAGMDLREVKEKYGDKLFLTGGIDISQLMAVGSPDEVREQCREAIAVASPGYFIGSTTELDNGSKLENILAMIETVWGFPARK